MSKQDGPGKKTSIVLEPGIVRLLDMIEEKLGRTGIKSGYMKDALVHQAVRDFGREAVDRVMAPPAS